MRPSQLPVDADEVQAELPQALASEESEASDGTLTIQAPIEEVVVVAISRRGKHKHKPVLARASNYNGTIYCGISYAFRDFNGEFGTQRTCGVQSAPWYYKIDPNWQKSVVGDVSETGLYRQLNGQVMPQQSPHTVPAWYTFHGTFSNTGKDDFVYYNDTFRWRHNIGSGGNAELFIYGSLAYKGPS